MQKTPIPRTKLHASTLALGTDYFESTVSREMSMQLMDRYLEAGGDGRGPAQGREAAPHPHHPLGAHHQGERQGLLLPGFTLLGPAPPRRGLARGHAGPKAPAGRETGFDLVPRQKRAVH